jgi:hypothetical protein
MVESLQHNYSGHSTVSDAFETRAVSVIHILLPSNCTLILSPHMGSDSTPKHLQVYDNHTFAPCSLN